jgi:hypothetical protein
MNQYLCGNIQVPEQQGNQMMVHLCLAQIHGLNLKLYKLYHQQYSVFIPWGCLSCIWDFSLWVSVLDVQCYSMASMDCSV